MKKGEILWTREQLVLAISLYNKITFGQIDQKNPKVVEYSKLIGKTPGAVSYKLANFASLDPNLKQKGLDKTSKLDKIVWNEYMHNWGDLFFEGEELLAKKKGITISQLYGIDLENLQIKPGREAKRLVKVRVNQIAFRRAVLTNYNNACCMTGINMTDIIVASHIVPWSMDNSNRLNPANGLALNALHDKAFDKYLITVTEDLKIKISPKFLKYKNIESIQQNFIAYDGKEISEPKKFFPDIEFLKIHNEKFSA